ncbi:MAG: Kazal-type serine protease inhibitor domain-containing protein, partial [Polyangiales bacterium]
GGIAGCEPGGCGSTEYCALAGIGGSEGDCRSRGVCSPRPAVCTMDFNPVCGCDGVTYDNACTAAAAGASVDFPGPCPCFSNDGCEEREYCVRSPACQAGPGSCEPRPATCDEVFDPVCGCDDQTYDNECFANAAGTVVSADQPCDCFVNDDCEATEYCDAQTCDGPGYCALRPLDCPDEGKQVPTCDGVGWRNACVAAQNGVRVRVE